MPDDQSFDLAGCLDRVRKRDQIAARELVEHLHPLVIRIARAHLPRRVSEEDLAQEIFLKMFTCLDHLRAQKRRPELRWADLSERETDVLDSAITNENDVAPDDALAAKEIVQKLLEMLKPEDRMVIQYLDLE